jgi:hypothetical protein
VIAAIRAAPAKEDIVKYVLAFIAEERSVEWSTPEETREAMERWNAWDREAIEKGAFIACEPLEPSSVATTVRIRDDVERIVTDGPFAETREQLGGFALLECRDLDEALEWAKKVPMRSGSIEVRPVMDLSEFGYESKTPAPSRATA